MEWKHSVRVEQCALYSRYEHSERTINELQKQKRRRITIEFLQEHFKEKECVLITQTYTNAHMELAYVCKNGHRTTTTWNNFSKGHGCLECSGRKKLNIEDVRACFEKKDILCYLKHILMHVQN